jgi:hypothetical protein
MTSNNLQPQHSSATNPSETEAVHTYLKNGSDLIPTNNQLKAVTDNLDNSTVDINSMNSIINDKRQRLIRQEAEIAQKKKIILTRNRMLNISEANNRYNQKLIYTFVSIVFGLFIIMLVLYTYNNKNYSKKSKVANSVGNAKGNANNT